MNLLPKKYLNLLTQKKIVSIKYLKKIFKTRRNFYQAAAILDLIFIIIIVVNGIKPLQRLLTPILSPMTPLQPLTQSKSAKEVFGFAPYWTFKKLANVNFNVLTTFAYFGIEVDSEGSLVTDDPGYRTFHSPEATTIFRRAHQAGTRVVLTLTQMKNEPIKTMLDNPIAQQLAIENAVAEVRARGIDGINVDFEYTGDPGSEYRQKYTQFVKNLTERMHSEIAESRVTVSVYASSVKDPKIYDIAALSTHVDGIFMMAYDFSVASSANAIPTAPLHGHERGKYWYDVATAVNDFLTRMPAEKLILGTPWYGYNQLVYEPGVKAETLPSYSWKGRAKAQTYGDAQEQITASNPEISDITTGWDENGQVGYTAYFVPATNAWRMLFLDDPKSLGIKYDFANEKNLGGVGIWALGFDNGTTELWELLSEKFGNHSYADSQISQKVIKEVPTTY